MQFQPKVSWWGSSQGKLGLESAFLQNGSGSFGMDKVGSEIGVNEQLLLGRKEENETVN